MSPRRKLEPTERSALPVTSRRSLPRWRFPLMAMLAVVFSAAAITLCAMNLYSHESQKRMMIKNVAVLGYIRSFMTEFTSPDPFHANDYTDRILAEATGEFAEQYRESRNEILIRVARAEAATGTVLDAGVSKWNDDGSADVLVLTKFTSKSPNGKLQLERVNRWVVAVKQEGQWWKISRLTPVI
ncbi:mammalian cell entry protein [Mycolicibacter icosiumassiliensis]|uniref:mammalian cell entry protein n=1 Tax=Mycolicibacter icosiumassiliensis TaxID=1792835 RepID=UPI0008328BCE|nr:mammalian cell entry protein [Mycolicibacter icosiumassiliensis]